MLEFFFGKFPASQLTHICPPCNIMIFAIKNHRAITIKYNVPYFHVSSSSYLYICTSEWIYRIHSEIRLKFPGWVFPLTFLYLRPRRGFPAHHLASTPSFLSYTYRLASSAVFSAYFLYSTPASWVFHNYTPFYAHLLSRRVKISTETRCTLHILL